MTPIRVVDVTNFGDNYRMYLNNYEYKNPDHVRVTQDAQGNLVRSHDYGNGMTRTVVEDRRTGALEEFWTVDPSTTDVKREKESEMSQGPYGQMAAMFGASPESQRTQREQEVSRRVAQEMEARAIEAEAVKRIGIIESFGADAYADETVISFKRSFAGSDKVYTYAAIKLDGKWHLTGAKAPQAIKWTDLLVWLVGEGDPATDEISVWDTAHTIGDSVTGAVTVISAPAEPKPSK